MGQKAWGRPLTQEEDRALAEAAARGDMEAFTALVRRHESAVRAFLARVGGREGADDIAQETFLNAWRKAGAFRGTGSYRGWLLSIAWNEFLSARRRRRPEAMAELPEATHDPRPDVGVDADRALATLDPRERAAALLCFGYGHSHGEAAEIMRLPLGTLKSLAARARAKLVEYLGDVA